MNELARLLTDGKSSVVANWRTRSATFPAPLSGGAQPRFDVFEVLDWLETDGPKGREVPEIRPTWWWRKMVETYADQADDPEPRRTLVSLVLLRYVLHHFQVPSGKQLWAALEPDQSARPGWAEAAGAAERACPEAKDLLVPILGVLRNPAALRDLVPFLDEIGHRHTERQLQPVLDLDLRQKSTKVEPSRTESLLAQLVVALAMPKRGDKVFDPAAGEGQLLVESSSLAKVVELYGQELDERAWEVAASRTLVLDATTTLAPPGHDSLHDDQFPDLRADAVVLDPPLDDKAANLEAWLVHAYGHLAEGGRLAMVVPAHQLVPVLSSRRRPDPGLQDGVRTLVGERAVEAIAVLPRRVRRDVVGPLLVLVLRRGEVIDRPVVISYEAEETSSIRSTPRVDIFVRSMRRILSEQGYDGLESMPYVNVERTSSALLLDLVERKVEQLELGTESSEHQTSRRKPVDTLRSLSSDVAMSLPSSERKPTLFDSAEIDRREARRAAGELERLLRPLLSELWERDRDRVRSIDEALARLLKEL